MALLDESALLAHLKWAEGYREHPYHDSADPPKLTIGYGRNLDDVGIRNDEATLMLMNDMRAAVREARTLPYWDELNNVRQLVLSDMVFNMGLPTVMKFKKMHAALAKRDWTEAAAQMQDSKWYRQTARRAVRLVTAMQTGEWDG